MLWRDGKFPQNSATWQQKLKFFRIFLKNYPSKGKNVFEKMNYFCFVTWAVTLNLTNQVCVIYLPCKKMEQVNFCFLFLFAKWAENWKYVPRKWDTSKNFWKNVKNEPKTAFLIYSKIGAVQRGFRKNQRSSDLNQHRFKENQHWNSAVQRWFLALKFFVFSAVQSWIRAVQRNSGNEQRWNRPAELLHGKQKITNFRAT